MMSPISRRVSLDSTNSSHLSALAPRARLPRPLERATRAHANGYGVRVTYSTSLGEGEAILGTGLRASLTLAARSFTDGCVRAGRQPPGQIDVTERALVRALLVGASCSILEIPRHQPLRPLHRRDAQQSTSPSEHHGRTDVMARRRGSSDCSLVRGYLPALALTDALAQKRGRRPHLARG